MFVKERQRLIDEVLVERLSHVVLDVARHADQNPALQKEKDTADETCAQHFAGSDGEFRPGDFIPILVNRLANDEGNEQTHRRAGEDAEYSDC